MPKVVRTVGKKNGYIVAGALAIIAGIGISVSPPSVPAVAVVFFTLMGVALAAVNILMFALEADTVEYSEWKTGVRTEGITYALFSFTRKLGQAVGGAMAAYAISLGGYIAGARTQSADALHTIRYTAGFVPAAFILIAIVIMYFYPLTEARFTQVVAETAERRAARAAAESHRPAGP
jgi:glucuronide carrier protein